MIIRFAKRKMGIPMLDGGMADAIPIEKALEEGWKKIIVVATRNSEYRKKQRYFYMAMIRLVYHKYPKFVEAVRSRSDRYNRSLETLKDLEREGNVFVLRPGAEICLTNNEADADKLREYYRHGYETAEDKKEIIKNFLLNT